MGRKYIILDLQGTDWWTWTRETPLTKHQVKNLFIQYALNDDITIPKTKKARKKYMTFDFIEDLWECRIISVNKFMKGKY